VAVAVSVPSSLTGSFPLFCMTFYSYIADAGSPQYRTVRFGVASVCLDLGISVGSAIGGFLLTETNLGFSGIFIIAAGIEVFVFVSTIIFVKNKPGKSHIEVEAEDFVSGMQYERCLCLRSLKNYRTARFFEAENCQIETMFSSLLFS
jgi:MFS family permease